MRRDAAHVSPQPATRNSRHAELDLLSAPNASNQTFATRPINRPIKIGVAWPLSSVSSQTRPKKLSQGPHHSSLTGRERKARVPGGDGSRNEPRGLRGERCCRRRPVHRWRSDRRNRGSRRSRWKRWNERRPVDGRRSDRRNRGSRRSRRRCRNRRQRGIHGFATLRSDPSARGGLHGGASRKRRQRLGRVGEDAR
jgi:hypothetical protein